MLYTQNIHQYTDCLVFLSHFIFLTALCSNNFSSEIPKCFANCSYLNGLKLNNNQLSREILTQIDNLNHLNVPIVSNNQLLGLVPVFGSTAITAESFANNKNLCGKPLEPCPTQKRGLKFDFSFQSGFLVGYVVSAVLVMTIFVSRYVVCMNERKMDKKMTLSNERCTKNENKEANQVNQSQTKGLLQEGTKKALLKLLSTPCFNFFGKI